MNQIKIGEFLKELRKEKGITQEQLAEQFNVSRRSVSRWETGSNMPDLSLLIMLAEYYEVDVKEIIEGKRRSENMNEEMKDTLEKVAGYNEMLNLKSMRKGIIIMSIVFIIMVQISLWKEVSPAPLVSLICAYNGATFISKARESKDKSDFITGSIFFAAMLINTIAFIVKWLTSHIKGYVARLVDELVSVVILKNNAPRYLIIDFSKVDDSAVAKDEDVLEFLKRLLVQNKEQVLMLHSQLIETSMKGIVLGITFGDAGL